MATSQRFKELEERLRMLRRMLLPSRFSDTGEYPQRVVERTRGYIVLSHAEFESYLEDAVLRVADLAEQNWAAARRATPACLGLLAFSADRADVPSASGQGDGLDARLRKAKANFSRWVTQENHGLRERNVLRLLLPVGLRDDELDAAWLATVDSFCRNRGETAHRTGAVVQVPDPKSEFNTVRTIVAGLRRIDAQLQRLA